MYLYNEKFDVENRYGTGYWDFDYVDGMLLWQYYEQMALQSTIRHVIAAKEAKSRGLKLTSAQESEARAAANAFINNSSKRVLDEIGMSRRQIQKFMEDVFIWEILYDDITKDFVFDQNEFEIFYGEMLEEYEKDLIEYFVVYIMTETLEAAEEARAKALAGTDIYDIMKEYCIDYAMYVENLPEEIEETGFRMEPELATEDFMWMLFDFLDDIYKLDEGDISDIFEIPPLDPIFDEINYFLFVYVDNIVHPDYEDLEEYLRGWFTQDKMNDIYHPILIELINRADFILNQNVIKMFHIADLPL
jgi:hypothetical protein